LFLKNRLYTQIHSPEHRSPQDIAQHSAGAPLGNDDTQNNGCIALYAKRRDCATGLVLWTAKDSSVHRLCLRAVRSAQSCNERSG